MHTLGENLWPSHAHTCLHTHTTAYITQGCTHIFPLGKILLSPSGSLHLIAEGLTPARCCIHYLQLSQQLCKVAILPVKMLSLIRGIMGLCHTNTDLSRLGGQQTLLL